MRHYHSPAEKIRSIGEWMQRFVSTVSKRASYLLSEAAISSTTSQATRASGEVGPNVLDAFTAASIAALASGWVAKSCVFDTNEGWCARNALVKVNVDRRKTAEKNFMVWCLLAVNDGNGRLMGSFCIQMRTAKKKNLSSSIGQWKSIFVNDNLFDGKRATRECVRRLFFAQTYLRTGYRCRGVRTQFAILHGLKQMIALKQLLALGTRVGACLV